MFSLESPHRGDSNVYMQITIFDNKEENHPDYTKYAAMGLFPRHSRTSSKQSW